MVTSEGIKKACLQQEGQKTKGLSITETTQKFTGTKTRSKR